MSKNKSKTKRHTTGYQLFTKENRPIIKANLLKNNETSTPQIITKILAKQWKELSSDEQNIWVNKAKILQDDLTSPSDNESNSELIEQKNLQNELDTIRNELKIKQESLDKAHSELDTTYNELKIKQESLNKAHSELDTIRNELKITQEALNKADTKIATQVELYDDAVAIHKIKQSDMENSILLLENKIKEKLKPESKPESKTASIPTKIFIIPYRNRKFLKIHFEKYMQYILEDIPKETYETYFVHQCDKRPFNRGALKNIGFLAIRNKYPNNYKNITFIFNDIDTMPLEKNCLNYDTTIGVVKHFYGFDFALGGIFSITGADFEKCGGFPNYWAWGLEDNAIQNRVLDKKIKLDRSHFYKFCDEHILHVPYDIKRILSKQQAWRHKGNTESFADIKNLKYTFENEFIQVTNFNTKVDPKDDNYVTQMLTNKILPDKNFIPKDSNVKLLENKFGMGINKMGKFGNMSIKANNTFNNFKLQ